MAGVNAEFELLRQQAGRMGAVLDAVAAPTVAEVLVPRAPRVGPYLDAVENYHDAPEWGAPFSGAVPGALDQALAAQADKINRVVRTVSAAIVGVSQATMAYQQGNEEMAVQVQAEAARSASTGDFSYFDALLEP